MDEIYKYYDVADFIRKWMSWRRQGERDFTLQKLAEELGVQSKSYISNVLNGDSTLSDEMVEKLTKIIGLDDKAALYFKTLVSFKQSDSLDEKNKLWTTIEQDYQGYFSTSAGTINKTEIDYLSHWYIPVVKEVVVNNVISGNLEKIRRLIVPQINMKQLRFALDTLKELNLIKIDSKGVVRDQQGFSIVQSELSSLAIKNFQKENIELAKGALDSVKRTDRDISTMTVGTTLSGIDKIEDLITKFQQDLINVVEEEGEKVERVYTVNIQMFPSSKIIKKGKLK